jgi:hypothetical protein
MEAITSLDQTSAAELVEGEGMEVEKEEEEIEGVEVLAAEANARSHRGRRILLVSN